jgi:hypothetical protein
MSRVSDLKSAAKNLRALHPSRSSQRGLLFAISTVSVLLFLFPLPQHLQPKLNLPRRRRRTCDRPRRLRQSARIRRRRRCKYNQVRRIKISSVQQIEKLRAKLQREPLADPRILQHRVVPCHQPRSTKRIPSQIPVKSARGWRPNKRRRIKPLRRVSRHNVSRKIRIHKRPYWISRVPIVRGVIAQLWRDRESRLCSNDARHRPPAHQSARPAFQTVRIYLTLPEWQRVDRIDHRRVTCVERRQPLSALKL